MTTKIEILKLKALAALGNAAAMYELSYHYLYGLGVEECTEKAHEYLQKAASKGFEAAQRLLPNVFADNGHSLELIDDFKDNGFLTLKKLYHDADKGVPEALYTKSIHRIDDDVDDYRFFSAINDLKKASRQGYPPALFTLGSIYHFGTRISGKESDGLNMIHQAANMEFIPALQYLIRVDPESVYDVIKRMSEKPNVEGEVLHMLALYYRDGIVVEKDVDKYVRLLKDSANKGCGDAFYDLGMLYESGNYNVSKDIHQAIAYLEKGVELDNAPSMLKLGYILEQSEEWPHDYKRAFELYSKVADLNDSGAINNLGTCYKRGIGTPEDKDKALACYVKAAKLGFMDAFWNLYLYYMDGYCVERNFDAAVEWLKKGDEAGNLRCTYQLTIHIKNGDGIETDGNAYFHYMKNAAMGGYKEAFLDLGNCYRYGVGTAQDGIQAFVWYRKASEFSIDGIALLGQCYTYGIGTPRDDKKAVELYQIAAEKGNAQAQHDLGICYRQGEGVEQDPLMAIKWYTKAADQGHGDALCNLGIMYDNGIGVAKDAVKAFGFFNKSASAGSVQGQFCLGDMYFCGRGAEQNYPEAVKCFKESASQGEPDSMFHLAICYNEGLGVEKDPEMGAYFLYAAADRGFPPAVESIKKYHIPRPAKDIEFK